MINVIYKFTIISFLKRDGNKPFYVGQHIEKKSVEHFLNKCNYNYDGSGSIWIDYVEGLKRKYKSNWRHFIRREILWSSETCSQKALDKMEEYFIKKEKAHYSYELGGTNVLWGTANNFSNNPMHDKRIVDKIREKKRGKYKGENCYWYGKTLSDETKNKLSVKAKNRLKNENPLIGSHLSKETRIKISDKNKGKRWITNDLDQKFIKKGVDVPIGWRLGKLPTSEETKEKLRQCSLKQFQRMPPTMKGKHLSDEAKMILSKKAIERYSKKENHPFLGRKHSEEAKKKLENQN